MHQSTESQGFHIGDPGNRPRSRKQADRDRPYVHHLARFQIHLQVHGSDRDMAETVQQLEYHDLRLALATSLRVRIANALSSVGKDRNERTRSTGALDQMRSIS